jgi:shikimate dehydrogenase
VFQPGETAINATTRCCAVYGFPIRHTASPAMQNAAFAALGLNWRYLAFEVHPRDLRAAIEGARAMGFAGLNLTVPHKLPALKLMDALDQSAKKWGAVNTVCFESTGAGGRTKVRAVGFNTDADAIAAAVGEDLKLELRGARVLLLGAGGAGRTAALKLAAEKVAELYLVNRTVARARTVAAEIKKLFPSARVTLGYPASDVDLLINATSLGLNPGDSLPLDKKRFAPERARAVYDMIYRPAETALLKTARKAGCKTANGLGMLLHQGAKAFEIWTGKAAPLDVMRRALETEVYRSNVHSLQSGMAYLKQSDLRGSKFK